MTKVTNASLLAGSKGVSRKETAQTRDFFKKHRKKESVRALVVATNKPSSPSGRANKTEEEKEPSLSTHVRIDNDALTITAHSPDITGITC